MRTLCSTLRSAKPPPRFLPANLHIKLANIEEKDANTITVDIVTSDKDALAKHYEINRQTGFIESME